MSFELDLYWNNAKSVKLSPPGLAPLEVQEDQVGQQNEEDELMSAGNSKLRGSERLGQLWNDTILGAKLCRDLSTYM